MTTRKVVWTPTTKKPKFNHALSASSAFNLKLCHMRTLNKTQIFVIFM